MITTTSTFEVNDINEITFYLCLRSSGSLFDLIQSLYTTLRLLKYSGVGKLRYMLGERQSASSGTLEMIEGLLHAIEVMVLLGYYPKVKRVVLTDGCAQEAIRQRLAQNLLKAIFDQSQLKITFGGLIQDAKHLPKYMCMAVYMSYP